MSVLSAPAMGSREWAMLVALSGLWGGSFFFGKMALAELQPLTLVLLRVAIAAAALLALARATGVELPVDGRIWLAFFAMGALNNLVPFSLLFWGQTRIASGLASILNATTPIFTVLVAHVLTRDEKLTAGKAAGVVAGLAGVAAMVGPDALAGLGLDLAAQLACLGAALSYAFAGVFGRRFRGLPPLATAAGQTAATTAMMLPAVALVDRPWERPLPGLETWGAVLGLALLSTALAYVLYFRILAAAGATNLLLVTFLIPVSALLLGMGVLGERLELRHFVGMAAIGVGLAAIDGRPGQFLARAVRADGAGRRR